MLGIAENRIARQDRPSHSAQPGSHRARLVESPHMGIGGPENTVRGWKGWIVLEREKQLRHCLLETPSEKMRHTYLMKCLTNAGTRTEAQRGLKIFDRAVGLPCPISQHP